MGLNRNAIIVAIVSALCAFVLALIVFVLVFVKSGSKVETNTIPGSAAVHGESTTQEVTSALYESANAEEADTQEESTSESVNHEVAETAETAGTHDIPTTMYVANVKNSIYLRSAPVEDDGNIITTIPLGAQVVWLENTNTVFSKVSYSTMTGYVKRDYLSARDPKQNAVSSGNNVASSGNNVVSRYVYVANVKNSIYLRSTAAEKSGNIITTIPVGTQVGYIETVNNVFSKIKYNGVVGYAKTIYLADYYNSGYEYMVVCNVKHSIYLRSEPLENPNNIICEIPLGSLVRYLGNGGGGFYKISYNGYVGYSKAIYLR